MYTTSLRKVGGSIMMIVPPSLLDQLHLQSGSVVGLIVDNGRLIAEPRRPHYSLEELLAQCDPNADFSVYEREWSDINSVGLEVLSSDKTGEKN